MSRRKLGWRVVVTVSRETAKSRRRHPTDGEFLEQDWVKEFPITASAKGAARRAERALAFLGFEKRGPQVHGYREEPA